MKRIKAPEPIQAATSTNRKEVGCFVQTPRLPMNRYLLFTYYVGAPCGGIKDLLDAFPTLEEALDNLLPEPRRYFQIVDRDSLEVVKEGLAEFKDADVRTSRRIDP